MIIEAEHDLSRMRISRVEFCDLKGDVAATDVQMIEPLEQAPGDPIANKPENADGRS